MVALSGGVDSATTAWLLQEQGQRIETMFMKNWEGDDPNSACPAEADAEDARAVARQLDIPFHARNFATEYWEDVFEHFLAELKAGRTPNPDILCNKEIKFKAFLDHALDLGATEIATGHYARKRDGENGLAQLLKGRDSNKDQSYFLHALNQDQLRHARFPLGEFDKDQVRQLAMQAQLPVATKKDSTGICFIGERNFDDFINRYLSSTPGPIYAVDGTEIGEHTGLMHYTLGQRRGLSIGGLKAYSEAPWYVAFKDCENNALYVCQDATDPTLMAHTLWASQIHWISGEPPKDGRPLCAKIRYRQADQPCEITDLADEAIEIRFKSSQRAVTPGQSVVFYDGDVCLGGAVIDRSDAKLPQGLS